jgi:hypothetical protein
MPLCSFGSEYDEEWQRLGDDPRRANKQTDLERAK